MLQASLQHCCCLLSPIPNAEQATIVNLVTLRGSWGLFWIINNLESNRDKPVYQSITITLRISYQSPVSGSFAALRYSLQGMLRIATPIWPGQSGELTTCTCMLKVELLLIFLKYCGWDIGSNLITFVRIHLIYHPWWGSDVFTNCVCVFVWHGVCPDDWIRWNDTPQTIVCSYIGGDVLFCLLCAMHSWRHWWRHRFKKLNYFLSTSVGINTVIIRGSWNIFLAQSSFGFG